MASTIVAVSEEDRQEWIGHFVEVNRFIPTQKLQNLTI